MTATVHPLLPRTTDWASHCQALAGPVKCVLPGLGMHNPVDLWGGRDQNDRLVFCAHPLNLPPVWSAQGSQIKTNSSRRMLCGLACRAIWAAAGRVHVVNSEAGRREEQCSGRGRSVGTNYGGQLQFAEMERNLRLQTWSSILKTCPDLSLRPCETCLYSP